MRPEPTTPFGKPRRTRPSMQTKMKDLNVGPGVVLVDTHRMKVTLQHPS